jgi:hypothetical protein
LFKEKGIFNQEKGLLCKVLCQGKGLMDKEEGVLHQGK